MKLGIFGGSFNPPHVCHAMVCQYALAVSEIERLLIVPTYKHPFGKQMAPYADRLEMCRLGFAGLGTQVEISDIESRLEGVSYTIDTLRALAADRPGDSFRLIIGSDIVGEVGLWKDFEEVKKIAPPFVVPRLRKNGDTADAGATNGELNFYFPDLSSTAIRAAIAAGRDVSGVLHKDVARFVSDNGLYA